MTEDRFPSTLRRAPAWLALLFAAALLPAHAHRNHQPLGPSEASVLSSALPVAVSVAAPVALLASGAAFTVVAVQSVSGATVWLLERASDGVRASVTFTGDVASGASLVAGTAVTASVIGTGWLLSSAGRVIAFVPNEVGKTLLYNERITR